MLGEARVSGLRLERTRRDSAGPASGTGQFSSITAEMVLRSVGYRGVALAGLPFDEELGIVPNVDGRVLRGSGPALGEYVTGWIRRGPTGVIGTNKKDAHQTVAALLADAPTLPPAPVRDPDAVVGLLAARGVTVVPWKGWCAIDLAEDELGRVLGRGRVKIAERHALLKAAAGLRHD